MILIKNTKKIIKSRKFVTYCFTYDGSSLHATRVLYLTVTNRECPTRGGLHDSVHGMLYSTNQQDRLIGHV